MNGLFVSIGAGPGIGGSTASRFAREGFDLLLAARDVSKLEPSAQKIRKDTGRYVETVALDAADFSAVQRFSERFGPAASILHYNAAAIQKLDVLEAPVETTQRNLSVDILGALAAIKYFAPYMEQRRKGTILLTGGGLALAPTAEYLSWSIGKAGIRCLAQALFPQLSAKGIHIATLTVTMMVSPGSGTGDCGCWSFLVSARRTGGALDMGSHFEMMVSRRGDLLGTSPQVIIGWFDSDEEHVPLDVFAGGGGTPARESMIQ